MIHNIKNKKKPISTCKVDKCRNWFLFIFDIMNLDSSTQVLMMLAAAAVLYMLFSGCGGGGGHVATSYEECMGEHARASPTCWGYGKSGKCVLDWNGDNKRCP